MRFEKIHSCAELMDFIGEVGFLPLLDLGIRGWSAESVCDEECSYVELPDGGWDWPLWDWKGEIIRGTGCAYGKFFDRKAAFISKEWWPDFCNWRRSRSPEMTEEDSIEAMIVATLHEGGSMTTRDLRRACGFTGSKMRGRFDSYVARLQMAGFVVTQDFVYPHDSHGRRYGWGWSLLSTPEDLFGKDACHPRRTPEESLSRLLGQLSHILPDVGETTLRQLLR